MRMHAIILFIIATAVDNYYFQCTFEIRFSKIPVFLTYLAPFFGRNYDILTKHKHLGHPFLDFKTKF